MRSKDRRPLASQGIDGLPESRSAQKRYQVGGTTINTTVVYTRYTIGVNLGKREGEKLWRPLYLTLQNQVQDQFVHRLIIDYDHPHQRPSFPRLGCVSYWYWSKNARVKHSYTLARNPAARFIQR